MYNDIAIKGHDIGRVCLSYGFCFWAGFLVFKFLNRNPCYYLLFQEYPFISRYIMDSVAFIIGLTLMWRRSHGDLSGYGFIWRNRPLGIETSIVTGLVLGILGILINQVSYTVFQAPFSSEYSFSLTNFLGMMSFQWIFVGIFEETITRGLVQAPLMEGLNGSLKLIRWELHIGSVVTALIFGAGHFFPHVLLGGSLITLPSHLFFTILYGLCSSYIFQETRSLVGPILMHNLVDGLIHTYDYVILLTY